MDTSTRQQRKKREIRTLRSKIGEMCPAASTRENADARKYRAFRYEKGGQRKSVPPHMVVAADPGSIPCKCRPAKPYLTHPSPADSSGSLDLFRSHPHLSAGFRIRSSHHFESSSSKVAPLPVAKSPMRKLPSELVEPPILVNKLPSLPTTVEPVLV